MPTELTEETFLPRTGKNYFSPSIEHVPTGTTYKKLNFQRPVILIALSPSTVGTVYIYPETYPGTDAQSIPIPGGLIYLDARGTWYLRHSSGSTESFRVIDAGGAGNAAAILATVSSVAMNIVAINGTTQTALDFTGKFDYRTMASPAQNTDIDTASEELVAAAPTRRFLYVKNTSTLGQVLWFGFGVAAETGKGVSLDPGERMILDATTGITSQAVNVIADVANATAAYQTGT